MSLYIQSVVIDANVINARGDLLAMNDLEALFVHGIINMLKTSVLNIEFRGYGPGEIKAKSYGTIYGPNWVGHTEEYFSGGERPSMIEMVYKTLWGRVWMKRDNSNEKHLRNSFRDAAHLDICWMNEIDYFVTNEKKLLEKRENLYEQGFDVKIVTPEECLQGIMENLTEDIGTNDITIISRKITNSFPIFIGSNDCKSILIKDPVNGETLFQTQWIDKQLHIEANIYDSLGTKIAQLNPKTAPLVLVDNAWVKVSDPSPKVFNFFNIGSNNSNPEQYLRIGEHGTSYFAVSKDMATLLMGRILPSGHVVFKGKFFNSKGSLIAEIDKKLFRYNGMEMINCSGDVFPSWP